MAETHLKYLYAGELTIAATYETTIEERLDSSFPMTVLLYIDKGTKHHEFDGHIESYPQGSYLLIRKFTEGTLFKSFTEGQRLSRSYAFVLTDEYIRGLIREFNISQHLAPVKERIILLPENRLLKKLMDFVKKGFNQGLVLDKAILHEKTREALAAIMLAEPALAAVFREYTRAERIDLTAFMNQSFLMQLPLKVLASQSGRSLSTFNRDFKMIFGQTPHRWIMKKRLSLAKEMLRKRVGRPSEIYMQVGFEDLGHFSRSFKRQFGLPPSEFYARDHEL
ncbi:MAG: helix-turn-helix transcriptional regulator [Roseivirga sp.]|nr:helix-turn-helix transcriptional regulator [Roseivirga sp.]